MRNLRYISTADIILMIAVCAGIIQIVPISTIYKFYSDIILFLLLGINSFYHQILSRRLPGESKYNPLSFIELHIGYKNKGNRKQFYKLSAETILIGIKEKKDVCFTTWSLEATKVNKLFGQAAIICKPGVAEYCLCMIARWYYTNFKKIRQNKNPIIKVIVKTRCLTNQQAIVIKKMAA